MGQVRLCPQKAAWDRYESHTESGKGQVRLCLQKAAWNRDELHTQSGRYELHRKRQGTGTNYTESGMGQVRLCPQEAAWDRYELRRKRQGTGTTVPTESGMGQVGITQKAAWDRYELHRKRHGAVRITQKAAWDRYGCAHRKRHGTGTNYTESGMGRVRLCTRRKKGERGGAGGGVTKILAQTWKKYFNLSLLAKAAFKGIVLKSGSYCPQMSAMSLQE